MNIKFFDVHSHVNFSYFDEDREAVMTRMKEAGVATITVGVDSASSKQAVTLAEQYDNIWVSIGLHPMDNQKESFDPQDYADLVQHPKVVAIGECGLDYFRIKGDTEKEKKRQEQNFIKQIEFAIEYDKPLMLHCRQSRGTLDAYEDVLSILNSYFKIHASKLRGNVHFFVGSVAVARLFLDIGFTLSFPGVITFASDYDKVVASAPIDMILSETDAPFAAPVPYRGKRNEPLYVKEVVRRIAQLRKEPYENVKEQLVSNALRVFNIPSDVA